MEINIGQIILIIVLASLAYWANATINTLPVFKTVVSVIIVVVAVLCLLTAIGLMGASMTIRV